MLIMVISIQCQTPRTRKISKQDIVALSLMPLMTNFYGSCAHLSVFHVNHFVVLTCLHSFPHTPLPSFLRFEKEVVRNFLRMTSKGYLGTSKKAFFNLSVLIYLHFLNTNDFLEMKLCTYTPQCLSKCLLIYYKSSLVSSLTLPSLILSKLVSTDHRSLQLTRLLTTIEV